MAAIEREEFNSTMERVFDKMDSHQATVSGSILALTVQVTKIQTRFNDLSVPELPKRPCTQLEEHLGDHKDTVDSWKRPVVVGFIVTAFLFIQQPIKEFFAKLFK